MGHQKNHKPFKIIQAVDDGILVSERYKISGECFLTLALKLRIVEARANPIQFQAISFIAREVDHHGPPPLHQHSAHYSAVSGIQKNEPLGYEKKIQSPGSPGEPTKWPGRAHSRI